MTMSEEKVSLDKKVDDLEAAAKKYASKDTVISVGGYDFTPAKLMVAATIVSSTLGGLYGVFEVYKDYMGMKKKIAEYVSPDFSEFDKRLAVIEENIAKTSKAVQDGSDKTAEYTRDIKNDLKGDIRRLEKVVEAVESSNKTQQREIDKTVQEIKVEVRSIQRAADQSLNAATKEMNKMSADNAKAIAANNREVDAKLKALDRKIGEDLKKALDNPLANK
jgi:tetrahydromethanopterin S-methyltransferase subunit F